MLYSMETPGLAALLGWSEDLTDTSDICSWPGISCYDERIFEMHIENQGTVLMTHGLDDPTSLHKLPIQWSTSYLDIFPI